MTDTTVTTTTDLHLNFDLGTFEGFNFRHQSAIERNLTAQEIVSWDHSRDGEAEFWPSGDHAGVTTVFAGRSVSGSELAALDCLLKGLGGDDIENFLRIHYAVNVTGMALAEATPKKVDDLFLHVYRGPTITDVRRLAAYNLFEQYYLEAFRMGEPTPCDGLTFNPEVFMDSPRWRVEELRFGDEVVLLVILL